MPDPQSSAGPSRAATPATTGRPGNRAGRSGRRTQTAAHPQQPVMETLERSGGSAWIEATRTTGRRRQRSPLGHVDHLAVEAHPVQRRFRPPCDERSPCVLSIQGQTEGLKILTVETHDARKSPVETIKIPRSWRAYEGTGLQ